MIKHIHYNLPVWRADICLYIGPWDKFMEHLSSSHKLKDSLAKNPNHGAMSMKLEEHSSGITTDYVMWIPEFSFKVHEYTALAHETLHIVCYILDDRGVVYEDDAKEVLTYTFDAVYEYMLNKLFKEYKNTPQNLGNLT